MSAAVLDCLHSPRRRELLRLVWTEERAAGELHEAMGDVTFGAVSQHLAKLADAGLVTRRAEGRRRLYRARQDAVGPLRPWLEAMWDDSLSRLADKAEARERRKRAGSRRSR